MLTPGGRRTPAVNTQCIRLAVRLSLRTVVGAAAIQFRHRSHVPLQIETSRRGRRPSYGVENHHFFGSS